MLLIASEKVVSAPSAVRATAYSIRRGANVVSFFRESQNRLFAHPKAQQRCISRGWMAETRLEHTWNRMVLISCFLDAEYH